MFCCAFISQYDVGDGMSIRGLLSCVFYSWTTGGASFVKTATTAAARVLMAAAHLWIIQTAEKGTEPIYSGNCYCTVAGQSLNLSATAPLSSSNGHRSLFIFPKGCKVEKSKHVVTSRNCG